MDNLSRGCGQPQVVSTTPAIAARFDHVGYARKRRYRLRNLHDGGAVPPARRRKSDPGGVGYTGQADRWDAIVGYDGYVAMDGDCLSIFLAYKTGKGVNRAIAKLEAMDARVDQVGDTEVDAKRASISR